MERWVSKVAVVTGASSGIGASVVQELVRQGMVVVGLARRKEKVERLADALIEFPGKLHSVECDVSKEESVLAAFAWIREELGTVDVLVNNAGIAKETTLTEGSLEEWRAVFDVNVFGLCLCTREAVRLMREGDVEGLVVHVNSLAGERVPAVPGFGVYPGSKRALTAMAETLRHELRATKIRVTCVSPGLVATELLSGYSAFSEEALAAMPALRPDDVAAAIVYVLSTPPHVQPPSPRFISKIAIALIGGKDMTVLWFPSWICPSHSSFFGQLPSRVCKQNFYSTVMERWVGKLAMVTGAADGIGAAIAEALVKGGVNVLALDVKIVRLFSLRERLRLARGKLYPKQCDVNKLEEIEAAFKFAKETAGGVDILINNAGVTHLSNITDGDTEGFLKVLQTNVLAVALFTKEAVRSMRDRQVDGHIININSIFGHQVVGINRGLYAPSKFAVTAMTETVRRELIGIKSGIKITSISPGAVSTEILDAAAAEANVPVSKMDVPRLEPSDVADAAIYILSTPPNVHITEFTLRPLGETL
ncbi:uncharacterized short-chain type dehydrogenase/reductase y4vI [Neodiprion lecontei]|uniref:Uncharacterized short-chain type dehydrogenase/reductase y4vI n=1 Tax=Neodiprion lecontei TaxID=441921 RepID=A0A6J0BW01_NEOLC|nr:uncharacterized short-chain type dehydrogenase/reductase y4vI [Neodiprion lecontei]